MYVMMGKGRVDVVEGGFFVVGELYERGTLVNGVDLGGQ
jgi:hypothetical protein